ncbi:MAG: hypothetical protein IT440_02235 [Phycisphaeraceae bacterium]|nr:hypothetical protein [Phycisphaeraceae bacterium]
MERQLADWINAHNMTSSTPAQVLAALAEQVSQLRPITSASLLAWATSSGRILRLEQAAQNTQLSDEVRNIARAAVLLIERDGTSLDMSRRDIADAVSSLVAAGVLTTDERDELIAMASCNRRRACVDGLNADISEAAVVRAMALIQE